MIELKNKKVSWKIMGIISLVCFFAIIFVLVKNTQSQEFLGKGYCQKIETKTFNSRIVNCSDNQHLEGNTCVSNLSALGLWTGNVVNGYYLPKFCGNMLVEPAKGEACDDGNSNNEDACDNECQWTIKEMTPITYDSQNKVTVSGDGVVYDDDNSTTLAQDVANGTYLKVAPAMATPYIWIANTNIWNGVGYVVNNQVAKLRTFAGKKRDCVRSGGEIDCFWVDGTWETQGQKIGTYTVGVNPSRTAVNVETGDVWVGNRDSGTVTKLDINGVVKKTCSTGIGPRGFAIEEDGDVWVANYGSGTVTRLSGDDSDCTIKQTVTTGGGPYGLAIDSNGNIWLSNSAAGGINKINPTTGGISGYYAAGVYGITVDFNDNAWGGIWTGNVSGFGVWKVASTAANGSVATKYPLAYDTTGITIDLAGNIWASNYLNNKVVKIDQATGNALGYFDQLATGTYPHGIVGDSAGNIWSVQVYGDTVRAYNASGTVLGDYCVSCSSTNPTQNYTYSDMTGLNRAMLLRSGIWLAKFDSGYNDQHWGNLSWQESDPGAKQSIEILIRSSNDLNFTGTTWLTAAAWNSAALTSKVGRYLQIRINIRSNERGITPVVWDLKILQP